MTRLANFRLACVFGVIALAACEPHDNALAPIDPPSVHDQDLMTWDDYRPIPGHKWAAASPAT